MKVLLRTLGYIDRFNEVVAKTTAWLIFPILLIMTVEVIRRKGFNNPSIWSHEMSYFLCSILLMFGMAYVLKIRGHVSIDIFYAKFPPRIKAAIDIFFFLVLFMPFWFLAIKAMIYFAVYSYQINERDYWGCWFPILWPLKTWTLFGTVMLVIQGTAEFIRDTIWLVKGGQRP